MIQPQQPTQMPNTSQYGVRMLPELWFESNMFVSDSTRRGPTPTTEDGAQLYARATTRASSTGKKT